MVMEGLALTGAWVDREKGLLGLIVLEMGGSSRLCALLKPGEPVVLMGPTGTPTEIPENETLCLVGGGLGNAVLFSIGQAARAKGCRVLYFAGYRTPQDRYMVEQIEAAADVVVWCCDQAPGFMPDRPQDRAFSGMNIVAAMEKYASLSCHPERSEGSFFQKKDPSVATLLQEDIRGEMDIPLSAIDRMIVIGSDRMMAAVAQARHTVLKPYLKDHHLAIGSINSPMQCMMKEICAQCLQRHVDPVTGEETVVFSCFSQDQPLDVVDWACLRDRLGQNSLSEKLTDLWVKRSLEHTT